MIKLWKIEWGATFANTLLVDRPMHRPEPQRPWIGETADAPSGERDGWREGLWAELLWQQLWIPADSGADPTGWYGATGWDAFLVAARDQELFKLYLDKDFAAHHDCQLVEANDSRMDSKVQFYRVDMRVRDVDGTPFEI